MSPPNDLPDVTLYIVTYNEEGYVRAAVQSAFDQTYSPLEIILSDDCSDDRTFEVMREMAASYRGPHTVRLLRNERNLGIVGNVNRVYAEVSGDLVVAAAGDDISYPDRVSTLVEAWAARGYEPDGLCSGYVELMGSSERVVPPPQTFDLEEQCRLGLSQVLGATAAWTRRLWHEWGPLPPDCLTEDQILSFRALLSGGMTAVERPLVRWRRAGVANPKAVSRTGRTLWSLQRVCRFLRLYEADVKRWAEQDGGRKSRAERLLGLLHRSRDLAERDCRQLAAGRASVALYCLRLLAGTSWCAPRSPLARVLGARAFLRDGVLGRGGGDAHDPTDHRAIRGEP